jgi:hypothetical protein
MRRLAVLLLSACAGEDATPVTPDARDPECLDVAERTHACTVAIEASVFDFVTLTPYAGRPVLAQSTAWDVPRLFPLGCEPLFLGHADATGQLSLPQASCASIAYPPILFITVEGGAPDPRAPTAWDRRLSCDASGTCEQVFADIPVPSQALVASWRQELAAGGMSRADAGGLALFQYLGGDGLPAAGVVATSFLGVPLAPGTGVRFLDGDRQTLLPAETGETGASGMAMAIGLTSVGGIRNADYWPPSGLLIADGWVFVETLDQRK